MPDKCPGGGGKDGGTWFSVPQLTEIKLLNVYHAVHNNGSVFKKPLYIIRKSQCFKTLKNIKRTKLTFNLKI